MNQILTVKVENPFSQQSSVFFKLCENDEEQSSPVKLDERSRRAGRTVLPRSANGPVKRDEPRNTSCGTGGARTKLALVTPTLLRRGSRSHTLCSWD
jgi:hypothetical protein